MAMTKDKKLISLFYEGKVYFIPESDIDKYLKDKKSFTDEEIELIKKDFYGYEYSVFNNSNNGS